MSLGEKEKLDDLICVLTSEAVITATKCIQLLEKSFLHLLNKQRKPTPLASSGFLHCSLSTTSAAATPKTDLERCTQSVQNSRHEKLINQAFIISFLAAAQPGIVDR